MNRDGGGKPGRHAPRAGRQITDEEAALWEQLGRSVDKVKAKPRVPAHSDGSAASGDAPGPAPPSATGADAAPPPRHSPQRPASPARRPPPAPAPSPPAARPAPPPQPAEIDRRTLRQVGSGRVPIDDVLDLHGLTQETAHGRLRAFLLRSQAKGHRMVLVVTGKGAARAEGRYDAWPTETAQRGVLRRSVPMWLNEPDLRTIVVSSAPAGPRHGGEGALYIRLRKARSG